MAVRARRVIGPTLFGSGTTELPLPPAGHRWKTESWFFWNPGGTDSLASIELGPHAAARLPVFKSGNVEFEAYAHFTFELVINADDSWAIDVATLDTMILTVCAFELALP